MVLKWGNGKKRNPTVRGRRMIQNEEESRWKRKRREILVLKTGHEKRLKNVAKVTLYLHGILLSVN